MLEKLESLHENLISASIAAEELAAEEKAKEEDGDEVEVAYFTNLSESFSKTAGRLSVRIAKTKAASE